MTGRRCQSMQCVGEPQFELVPFESRFRLIGSLGPVTESIDRGESVNEAISIVLERTGTFQVLQKETKKKKKIPLNGPQSNFTSTTFNRPQP